tara:strand:+ start:2886 stop:3533 length:648 start_codon:yes stop_codon:yes gene_type:complete
MYAILNDDKTSIQKIISGNTPITDSNGVQHPSSIFANWSKEELANINVVPVVNAASADNKYYNSGQEIFTIADDKSLVNGSRSKTEKSLEDVTEKDEKGNVLKEVDGSDLITAGLKSIEIRRINKVANDLISQFSWQIERSLTTDPVVAIDDVVKKYINDVRTAHTTIKGKINACDTMDKFKALFVTPVDGDGKVTGNAPIDDFPSQKDVEQYKR